MQFVSFCLHFSAIQESPFFMQSVRVNLKVPVRQSVPPKLTIPGFCSLRASFLTLCGRVTPDLPGPSSPTNSKPFPGTPEMEATSNWKANVRMAQYLSHQY